MVHVFVHTKHGRVRALVLAEITGASAELGNLRDAEEEVALFQAIHAGAARP